MKIKIQDRNAGAFAAAALVWIAASSAMTAQAAGRNAGALGPLTGAIEAKWQGLTKLDAALLAPCLHAVLLHYYDYGLLESKAGSHQGRSGYYFIKDETFYFAPIPPRLDRDESGWMMIDAMQVPGRRRLLLTTKGELGFNPVELDTQPKSQDEHPVRIERLDPQDAALLPLIKRVVPALLHSAPSNYEAIRFSYGEEEAAKFETYWDSVVDRCALP